ncbi:MAG: SusC/RagA family TonB-linked outer membrane protein [Microbacter sp.]
MKNNVMNKSFHSLLCQKKALFILLITFFFAAFSQISYAATNPIKVTGKVTDLVSGESLPGVSVIVEGTTRGTITDVNGVYNIEVPSENSILTFSFMGYASQQIKVGQQTHINVKLAEAAKNLSEVVVVGYGIQKKSDVTGAVSSVSAKDFNKMASATPSEMIQGKIAGVQIISNSGEPGAGSQITIRGMSSIRAGSQPLYVVDGVPLDEGNTSPTGGNTYNSTPTDPLSFINPNDIASIDILKDASAAAIYGSRGANGVVIITTKKGKKGVSEVTYSTSLSIGSVRKKLSVLSADQWRQQRDAVLGYNTTNNLDPNDYHANTDWQNEVFRTAFSQDHNLTFTGGTETTQYRASLNYTDDQGIMIKSDMKKYIGSLNLTQKALNNKVTFNAVLNASEIVQNRLPLGTTGYQGDALINALQANPTWPAYNANGTPFQIGSANNLSPLAMIYYTNDLTRETDVLGDISANVAFTNYLSYKVNLALDYMNSNRMINQDQKLDYEVSNGGAGQRNSREMYNYLIEHTLNFDKTFGVNHLTVLGGYSYQNFQIRDAYMTGQGYITDALLYTNNIGSGDPTMTSISSDADSYQLQSYFGRVNYSLKDRYLLTATVRADGSSKFGVNHQYGVFPSFAGGWRLSEEPFIKKLNFFDNLKLRFGWGETGNSEIGTHNSQTLYNPTPVASAVIGGQTITGLIISKTPNPNITWEKTQSTDAGLEFAILGGRLMGDFDYFYKQTTNLLLAIPSQAVSPTSFVVSNIPGAKIDNYGVELSLTGKAIQTKDFSWEISGNMTLPKNIVKNLPVQMYQTGAAVGQGLSNAYCEIITSNQPIDVLYGKKITNIDSQGVVHYLQTKSGIDSLTYLGNPSPNFIWSLTNTFRYKNWDLNIFINGVSGNRIFNNTAVLLDKTNINTSHNTLSYFAYDNVATATYTPTVSSRYMMNGTYARLTNVTLGYTFHLKNTTYIKNLRVYLNGSNLLVITSYKGFDPDVTTSVPFGGNGVNSFGIDNGNYPKPRTFMLGINATF